MGFTTYFSILVSRMYLPNKNQDQRTYTIAAQYWKLLTVFVVDKLTIASEIHHHAAIDFHSTSF